MAAGLRLMKSVLTALAKCVLLPLGLSAGMSAADAAIQKKKKKKNHGTGTISLIISNGEIKDIVKIIKPLKESGLLIKVKGGFLSLLLGALAARFFRKCINRKRSNKNR